MILAFDLGSTRLKAGLYDDRGQPLVERARPLAYTVARSEFAVAEFWRLAGELIAEVCVAAGLAQSDCTRIAIASQAQTFTIVGPDDRPWLPFVSWADRRAVAEAAELTRALGLQFHQHCSFSPPIPQMQLAKLLWVRRHHPEWLSPPARVMSLPTYLAWRLAGTYIADRNLAAMEGLYSLADNNWWAAALAAVGLETGQVPRLVETGRAVAGAAGGPAVVLAGNDQTANAVGNGAQPGELLLVLGTALVVYRRAGTVPGPYRPTSCWGPYPGGRYYELATRDEGCAALDWAREQLLPGADLSRFLELAATAPDDLAAPFFHPARLDTPAAWDGAGTVAARARAVLEGISFSVRQLIEQDLGMSDGTRALCVCGGGSASDYWRQMLADVLRATVRRGTGDALRGAALMAADTAAAPTAGAGSVHQPAAQRADYYAARYREWRVKLNR